MGLWEGPGHPASLVKHTAAASRAEARPCAKPTSMEARAAAAMAWRHLTCLQPPASHPQATLHPGMKQTTLSVRTTAPAWRDLM